MQGNFSGKKSINGKGTDQEVRRVSSSERAMLHRENKTLTKGTRIKTERAPGIRNFQPGSSQFVWTLLILGGGGDRGVHKRLGRPSNGGKYTESSHN